MSNEKNRLACARVWKGIDDVKDKTSIILREYHSLQREYRKIQLKLEKSQQNRKSRSSESKRRSLIEIFEISPSTGHVNGMSSDDN